MLDTKELETKEAKDIIKHVVVDVLRELSEDTQPPDRLALFLYQFIGDFHNFKHEVGARFDAVDKRLDNVESDIVEMKGDIAVMKGDIVEMKGDIAVMKGDIVEMKGDIVEMKSTMLTQEDLKDAIVKIGVSVKEIIRTELDKR